MKALLNCKMLTALLVGVVMGLVNPAAMAADVGGSVKGVITTESGEPLAGANVTVTHSEKGVTRSTVTNADGEFVLRNLPVGDYTVTTSKDGYSTAKQENVSVEVGSPQVLETALKTSSTMDEVVVVGTPLQKLDMAASTAGMTFDQEELDLMPVDNGFENTALLVPGVYSNREFGGSSIAGASSAENGYYLNGINVTQIQQGIGSFGLPWEAIEQTNVQTGGITAEFGGALGGIVNAVSKSGTNEFDFGIEYRIDPSSTTEHHDSIRALTDPTVYWINNDQDDEDFTETSIWASGPIIQDKAFFYVLLNPREYNYEGAGNSTFSTNEETSDRWFVNLEWFLNDSHSIGFTAFDTTREVITDTYDYDNLTNAVDLNTYLGRSFFEDGGSFTGINYHGVLSDNLTLDAVWGSTEEEEIPRPANAFPLMQDCRSGSCISYSNHSNSSINPQNFVRDQLRLDFRLDLDDHAISFGYDSYGIDVDVDTRQNGLVVGNPNNVDTTAAFGWWLMDTCQSGDQCDSTAGVPVGTDYIRRRVRTRFSDSEVNSSAFYVQDSWQVSDEWTLNLGVRITDFENTVSSGEAYADLTGNVAPRLAAIWDIGGEGKSKFTASWGRYFQPVAARMNITQGSTSIEYFDYYALDQVDGTGRATLLADGSPSRGTQYGTRDFRQSGITDPNLIASSNLEAMYSDQISLSYETEVFDTMRAGIRVTLNELGRSVEDTDYGPPLENELYDLGIVDRGDDILPNVPDFLSDLALGQGSFYILANPSDTVIVTYDFDNADNDAFNTNGELTLEGGRSGAETITLTPDELLLPEPVRKYLSWELTLGGQYGDKINFDASYTWAHSYGNTEGLVKTDNGQADPGWTTAYDYADLMDGAYGNLPNDHRHSIKLSGTYDISDNLVAGFVFRATSGSPLNVFGVHPLGVDSCAPTNPWNACISQYYGRATHYNNDNDPTTTADTGELVPRGTAGTMPWVRLLNASLVYKNDDILGGNFSVKGTFYNLLNEDSAIEINELAGTDYGLTDSRQSARYLSIVGRLEF